MFLQADSTAYSVAENTVGEIGGGLQDKSHLFANIVLSVGNDMINLIREREKKGCKDFTRHKGGIHHK